MQSAATARQIKLTVQAYGHLRKAEELLRSALDENTSHTNRSIASGNGDLLEAIARLAGDHRLDAEDDGLIGIVRVAAVTADHRRQWSDVV